MTTYITHLEELEKLAKGEIKVEDIAKPENISILSWSGIDLKTIMANKSEVDEQEMVDKMGGSEVFEKMVNDFVDRLDGLGCGDCLTFAINDLFGKFL